MQDEAQLQSATEEYFNLDGENDCDLIICTESFLSWQTY